MHNRASKYPVNRAGIEQDYHLPSSVQSMCGLRYFGVFHTVFSLSNYSRVKKSDILLAFIFDYDKIYYPLKKGLIFHDLEWIVVNDNYNRNCGFDG
ncbi:hypothetical protein ABD07_07385 [Nitrosomonas oligotropha]|nr:hypothetical protein [Nitrosomonas oligotropha]